MSNRDIALNWQGLPLPVSRQFAVCLTDLLNTHHPTWLQARAVTMNFRDPGGRTAIEPVLCPVRFHSAGRGHNRPVTVHPDGIDRKK